MRATFYIGTIAAFAVHATQAIQLETSYALMAPDNHTFDPLSLA